MKRLLLLAFFVAPLAHADTVVPDRVYQVAIASFTVNVITVSTSTATQMDTPLLTNRVSVEVDNIDGTASLWCGQATSVAKNAARKIAASGSWLIGILDRSAFTNAAMHVYCISDGTSATKAAVTQMY